MEMNGNLREHFLEKMNERKHTPNVITTLRIKERNNLLCELNAYESIIAVLILFNFLFMLLQYAAMFSCIFLLEKL